MYLIILGLVAIGIWSYLDSKYGQIGSWWIIIPLVISFFLDWLSWMIHFAPLFGLFIVIYVMANLYGKGKLKFGFADVISIPFAVWIALNTGILMAVPFALLLAIQTILYDKMPLILVPKRDDRGNIRYITVLFNAFLGGLIVYGLSHLLV